MKFTSPCFSGECDLCANCCGNIQEKPVEGDSHDSIIRTEQFMSFMNDDDTAELHNDYWSKLDHLKNREVYKSPSNPGYIPKQIMYLANDCPNSSNKVYHLIQETHGAICDELSCQLRYVSVDDAEHMMIYPTIPVYTRTQDDKHQICAVCANESLHYSPVK